MTEPKAETLFHRAVADADEVGGRYARNAEVHVVGSAPLPWVAPAWCTEGALVPDEPPTGEDINAVPDQTTLDGAPR